MQDKNGIEMKTGDIVEITGAYFKNDNGLYFIDCSPGDPNWCGSDYSLKRISKSGKISKAKKNLCFWPIGIFISDRSKRAEGLNWNEQYAEIELKTVESMEEVSAYFQSKAEAMNNYIRRQIYDWGENHPEVQKQKAIQAHYAAVAQRVRKQADEKIIRGGHEHDRL